MSNLNTYENQTIALAGIFQSVSLCKNLATYGRCDEDSLAASLGSILKIDSDDILDIYNGVDGLKHGLRVLGSQLSAMNRNRDLELTRYSVSLLQLGNNLQQQPETLQKLQHGIEHANTLDFEVTDKTLINNLADLYKNNISHMSPRIMVTGNPEHLQNDQIASKVRACLLAGLRSVVLWRQCNGSRFSLIFRRTKYQAISEQLLHSV